MKDNTTGFDSLESNNEFDVVVIGGGINGIGVFRELVLQGVKVLLVEKDDFCSKASSAPSRMIHGGLRYLENGEFALVKEALSERNRLLGNAPHLVAPLQTTIPIYSTWSGIFDGLLKFLHLKDRPSQRGSVVIKLGLTLYDWFTKRDQVMPAHQMHSGLATQQRWPLMGEKVRSSATYFDAWISSPERLAIELIQEGIEAGGCAINYAKVTQFDDGELQITHAKSGQSVQVSCKHIVNATGAWVDVTNGLLRAPSQYMQGTKGSHIIVDSPELVEQLDGNMLFYENSEGRVCILFPYFGKVLVGSTDIPVSDPETVKCTDEEIDYILASLKGVLPHLDINRSQIVYQFSGVRPLPSISASTTGQIPRSHSIKREKLGEANVYSLIGGKWTTFRAFAEEVTDELLASLNRKRTCCTKQKAIGGGVGYPKTEGEQERYLQALSERNPSSSRQQITHWFMRYGTKCEEILQSLEGQSDQPLRTLPEYTTGEMTFILKQEFVSTTLDLMLRRTSIAIEGKLNNEVFEELSDLVANHFNWSATEKIADREATIRVLHSQHGLEIGQATNDSEKFAQARTKMMENKQLVNGEEYVFNQ